MLTTTLAKIKEHKPCGSGWHTLITYMGTEYPWEPFSLLEILESNGVRDCLWALRCTIEDSHKISLSLAIKFAEHVLHIFEAEYPDDKRPREALEAAREWLADFKNKGKKIKYQLANLDFHNINNNDAVAHNVAYAIYSTAFADNIIENIYAVAWYAVRATNSDAELKYQAKVIAEELS